MKPRRVSLGKTARPSLMGILPRNGLFALLDRGCEGPAVWVSGPPGCGKTTLVASWLDHASVPYLWYQLDEGDADVATFFYYLSLAAADLEAGEGERLPLLTPEYQAGLLAFARSDAHRAAGATAGRMRDSGESRRSAGEPGASARQPRPGAYRLGSAATHAR